MSTITYAACLALAPLLLGLPEEAPSPSEGALRVDVAVGSDEVLGHVAYLAADGLGGRFTGSPGGKLAADYLAARLEALVPHGLEPAGDDGTFLQDIHLTAVSFERLPILERGGTALTYGSDFELRGGHGLEAELEVLVVEEPEAAPAEADGGKLLYLSMNQRKGRELIEARGETWRDGWGAILERGFSKGRREVTDPARIRRVRSDGSSPRLVVHGEAREAFDSGEVERVRLDLGGTVKVAHNVVAILPGAGRERLAMGPLMDDAPGNRAVVLSAHYDHLRPAAPTSTEGARART